MSRTRHKHTKRALCALALAAALGLAGCAKEEEMPVPELLEPVGVRTDTAEVTRENIYTLSVSEGSVVAVSAELYFDIDGYIGEVACYPGKWVTEGEVLFTLDQEDLQETVDSLQSRLDRLREDGAYSDAIAETDIEIMRVELERLRAGGSDSTAIALKEADIAQAELDLRQARELRALDEKAIEADLEACSRDLGRNVITAPFDGNVFYLDQIVPGTHVRNGKAIAYIANPNDVWLNINAYFQPRQVDAASDIWAIVGDKRFSVTYEPLTAEEMSSRILAGKSLYSKFRLSGPEEDLPDARSGMYAALCVQNLRAENVLCLPSGAIYSAAGEKYVYVETEDGRKRRLITTGVSNGIVTEITSGLEEGERVYVKE